MSTTTLTSTMENLYFIFTDLKNYSKLSEDQTREYQELVGAELSASLKKIMTPKSFITFNTWGDAIYAAFADGEKAVEFALAYQHFFKGRKLGKTKLEPRIAGHFGPAFKYENPLIQGKMEVSGKHVNTTARIEPVVWPGETFVTEAFYNHYNSDQRVKHSGVGFEELGVVKLAKNHGEERVFRLKQKKENPLVLDKLMRADLSDVIPTMPHLSEEEKQIAEEIQSITSPDLFKTKLKKWQRKKPGALLLLKLANKARALGKYKRCLSLLEQADEVDMRVDGERVYAVRHLTEFKKIKANALTRLGEYKKAEDILFGLWHSGHQDADTLSMLAAQYKRRAIFGKSKTESIDNVTPDNINIEMLKRACKLYVEAFRKNIDEYYPAINAAYLYLLINEEPGKGLNLANLILNHWELPQEKNWYLAVTLAEAEMLSGDPEDVLKAFMKAVEQHKPTVFQLHATLEQIKIYAKLKRSKEHKDIIHYLEGQASRLANL